jgi:hypothetical protein
MRAILLAAVSLPLAPAVQAQAIELYATFTNTYSINIRTRHPPPPPAWPRISNPFYALHL